MQTLASYLKKGEDFLRKKGVEKPRLETQIIFAHVLNKERYQLYTIDDLPLKPNEVEKSRELLVARASGKPSAYVKQEKEFFSNSFFVDERVLIPRPETEELVEHIIESLESEERQLAKLKLLDLCCGSGCIGLSLKKEFPDLKVDFADISTDALEVTKINAERLEVLLKDNMMTQSDLFDSLKESYDFIVVNPPYILPNEYKKLDASVKNFEPQVALEVQEPSTFFKRLAMGIKKHLHKGGYAFIECSPTTIEKIEKIFHEIKFENIERVNDLSDRERFIHIIG